MYENGKIRPVEIIPGMGRGRDKGESGGEGDEFSYDVL
jgi:hypothetical protein